MTAAPEERPLRTCDECGQTDTDPKHIVVTRLAPTETVVRHPDCCVSVGCWHPEDHPQHCANAFTDLTKAGA
jgi:hypothetical protein